ncbi:MAG: VOC family protein [Gammaproteobacteria bacterium]|nr:VOC family protein [Gammaproteobacteria bacterium]MBU2057303.1 VOC family protein [Gammaproteobacteria bacterium]MBU2174905.1 VOC family protein [Gammaproteobacteria bacterium]MBU2245510.1 VOC family protein [Gammaproteobacteria bacterium]MBU2344456.1 VOC family protein [Gammaproteobacteria bacterium]
MKQSLGLISLLVADYDEAIEFYTQKLGFELVEDSPQGEKRWVVVRPQGAAETAILLAKASNEQQKQQIGNQSGGRVFLFLNTDDFWRDHKQMQQQGVKFLETPREEAYGTVAVFEDLYGTRWDLLQLN